MVWRSLDFSNFSGGIYKSFQCSVTRSARVDEDLVVEDPKRRGVFSYLAHLLDWMAAISQTGGVLVAYAILGRCSIIPAAVVALNITNIHEHLTPILQTSRHVHARIPY